MTISEYTDCIVRLLELYSAEEANKWMNSPHPQLGGRCAFDCKKSEVMAIIDRLESGAYL